MGRPRSSWLLFIKQRRARIANPCISATTFLIPKLRYLLPHWPMRPNSLRILNNYEPLKASRIRTFLRKYKRKQWIVSIRFSILFTERSGRCLLEQFRSVIVCTGSRLFLFTSIFTLAFHRQFVPGVRFRFNGNINFQLIGFFAIKEHFIQFHFHVLPNASQHTCNFSASFHHALSSRIINQI